LKKYNDDAAKAIVKRVFTDHFKERDAEGRYDGVTNLIKYLGNPNEDWAQSYTTIPILTDKFLYWLNQAYLEETTGKERVTKKGNHAGIRSEYMQQASINPFVAAA
jgi:hypothetical protein